MENEEKKDLQERLDNLYKQESLFKELLATTDLEIESSNNKAEKLRLENERSEYQEQLITIQNDIELTKGRLANFKNFNKENCINNIRHLLKEKNLKLGEIEKSSGNNPGYLSRIESGKNSADPSIEFLMTVSKALEVPLDTLVRGKFSILSPTEHYLINFINKLIEDTLNDSITWIKETELELDNVEIYENDYNNLDATHPLFVPGNRTDYENSIFYEADYSSRFFVACGVTIGGNCYHASIPNSSSNLYIMKCKRGNDRVNWLKEEFYELYLIDANQSVSPLCNTHDTNDDIGVAVENLVQSVMVSTSHVHIDCSIRNTIDAYMGILKEEPEIPFN